jgi:hypothetical protein
MKLPFANMNRTFANDWRREKLMISYITDQCLRLFCLWSYPGSAKKDWIHLYSTNFREMKKEETKSGH